MELAESILTLAVRACANACSLSSVAGYFDKHKLLVFLIVICKLYGCPLTNFSTWSSELRRGQPTRSGVGKLWLKKKVLLEQRHIYSFTYCLWLLL